MLRLSGILASILFVSACGGGAPAPTPVTEVDPKQVFSAGAQLLPDLKSKYDRLCGSSTSVQNAIPVDVNKDGKIDLIFNLWCLHQPAGDLYTGPVPNTLVAFVQDAQGKFTDKTIDVFGTEYPDIGGVGIRHVLTDFNGDGYQDIAFAVNREDGRKPTDEAATNHNAQDVVLMSTGTGRYDIVKVGQSAWNYGMMLRDNEIGTQDFVSIPFNKPGEVFRYTNGNWIQQNGYEWLGATQMAFFSRKSPNEGSTLALAPSPWGSFGATLWTKDGSTWSQSSSYSLGTVTMVPWITWSRYQSTNTMLSLDGKDYVSVSIGHTCELKMSPNEPSIGIMAMGGLEIVGGYKGGVVDELGGGFASFIKLLAFDVTNNTITRKNVTFKNELTTAADYRMSCGDINGDGYGDIMIHDWRTNTMPVMYINDRAGGFNRVNQTVFPTPPVNNGLSYVYIDIDGDGIRDLLYWAMPGAWSDYSKVQYRIHKGIRNINSLDMM